MSAVTQRRYRDARVKAFRNVLARWLAKLPAEGWEGGVGELGDALWTITRRDPSPTYIPFGTGLGRTIAAEVAFIQASGFQVEFCRTKRARTLRFLRGLGPSHPEGI